MRTIFISIIGLLIGVSFFIFLTPHPCVNRYPEAYILKRLGKFFIEYGKNNNNQYPKDISSFKSELNVDEWRYFDRIEYLGFDGKTMSCEIGVCNMGGLNKIVAYILRNDDMYILRNSELGHFRRRGMKKRLFYSDYCKYALDNCRALNLNHDDAIDFFGLTDLIYAMLHGDPISDISQHLVNTPDCNGFTPLMYAIIQDDIGNVHMLLELNAGINIQNCFGDTAIDIAKILKRNDIYELISRLND